MLILELLYTKYQQVGVELPIDSDEADEENKGKNGRTLLNVLNRGYGMPGPYFAN